MDPFCSWFGVIFPIGTKFVHRQAHVRLQQQVERQTELRPDVREHELVVQVAAAGDATQIFDKELGRLPVQPVGDEHLVSGDRHLPTVGQQVGAAGDSATHRARAVGQGQAAEREVEEDVKVRQRGGEAYEHVHLKLSKVKVGAAGGRMEEAREVRQHPKGHKDRHVVTSGRRARLQNLQSQKELLLAAEGGKGTVKVAPSVARPVAELSHLVVHLFLAHVKVSLPQTPGGSRKDEQRVEGIGQAKSDGIATFHAAAAAERDEAIVLDGHS